MTCAKTVKPLKIKDNVLFNAIVLSASHGESV